MIGVAFGVGLYLRGGTVAALNWFAPSALLALVGAAALAMLSLIGLKFLPDALAFAGIVAIGLMAIIAIVGPGFPGRAWIPGGFLLASLLMGTTSAFTPTFSILSLGVPLVMAAGRRSSSTCFCTKPIGARGFSASVTSAASSTAPRSRRRP